MFKDGEIVQGWDKVPSIVGIVFLETCPCVFSNEFHKTTFLLYLEEIHVMRANWMHLGILKYVIYNKI